MVDPCAKLIYEWFLLRDDLVALRFLSSYLAYYVPKYPEVASESFVSVLLQLANHEIHFAARGRSLAEISGYKF